MSINLQHARIKKNSSLSQQVVDRIGQSLINGELNPGDRLPSENELAEAFMVGKSSVREAVKMMQAMGVVETRQGEGTFVVEKINVSSVNPLVYHLMLGQGENQDILDLRMMFEPSYVLMAMERADDEDMESIKRAKERFEGLVGEGNQTADDDIEFHRSILNATHNPYVIRIGETIMTLFIASISKSMSRIPERAVHDHNVIYEALLTRDRQRVYNAVISSFDGWRSMMDNC